MTVWVETHNIGDHGVASEIKAVIEHTLHGRHGDWKVSVTGSRSTVDWELNIKGPSGFERSFTLAGDTGQNSAAALQDVLQRLLASSKP